jgi:hypothetical protein
MDEDQKAEIRAAAGVRRPLASLALGAGGTATGIAVVGTTFMIAPIWLAIAVVDITWSRRR